MAKRKGLETAFDLEEKDKGKLTTRATRGVKLLTAYYKLLLKIILSNTPFFCYFFMVICMIMNGSLLSAVYPISIFIYALLEEKRPSKNYWIIMLYFTSIVLVLKFIFQTYPFSSWITAEFVTNDGVNNVPDINSMNDYFRAMRLGLENLQDSGRDFVEFFLFEALILLSVTLHIFILIFGGVWVQREVEAEDIDQAAARISTAIKEKRNEEEKRIRRENEMMSKSLLYADQISEESEMNGNGYIEYEADPEDFSKSLS